MSEKKRKVEMLKYNNILNMKIFLLILIFGCTIQNQIFAQNLTGMVSSKQNKQPLSGASISLKNSQKAVKTNLDGVFNIEIINLPDTLLITHIGFRPQRISITSNTLHSYNISLEEDAANLSEVIVNTGYQTISKERTTGSFTQVNNELLNRNVSTNILDRLEGVANGLQFDRRKITAENATKQKPELRIRGLSTIEGGSSPLIIVDNFPYDGDIASINPNDIESVTLLKDAAAASIWGARAGNGVIVINSKQGNFNQATKISFNSSVNLIEKPDLFYTRNYLPSKTTMEIQKELFQRGAYTEDNMTYIPAYVELLIKQRDGKIGSEDFNARQLLMQQTDFRNQALGHLYQTGINQQYSLNVNGGGNVYKYYLSAGYDKIRENVIANSSNRINLTFQNTFKIKPTLELSASVWYSNQKAANNGITYSTIGEGIREPYTLLADLQGNSLPAGYFNKRSAYAESAVTNGLLDWQYRPLDELNLTNRINNSNEIRLNGGLKYSFFNNFNLNITYQYLSGTDENQTFYNENSYYVRNLVNRFTQPGGLQVVPKGGILDGSALGKYQGHSARAQLNYTNTFAERHQITALAGIEAGGRTAEQMPGFRLYSYSDDYLGGSTMFDYTAYYPVLPSGSAQIEGPSGSALKTNDRNLSYFSNASYSYDGRYTVSGSARWDGSNLLGVKTNQRGTVLWSTGLSWEISKENFYSKESWMPYVRARVSYGSGGLIDKSQSQYPTIALLTDSRTQYPYANLMHPGNPSLRWEQVNTLNLGVDWSSKANRLSGSFEWYNKDANHLLGSILIDPTTGAGSSYKLNYADMRTRGFDLQINSININKVFKWESSFLIGYARNKIKDYNTPKTSTITSYFNNRTKPPVAGRSVDVIYAYPWNGLSNENGYPIIYIDGKLSGDYSNYTSNYKPENLVVAGIDVPPVFGSIRNSISWKGIQLSALLSFKTGYVFRRTSMEPGAEYETGNTEVNLDYGLRWKQPGDEQFTNVPANVLSYNSSMAALYSQSMALITKGDHIRLQDINLSYTLPAKLLSRLSFQQVRFYMYTSNLGILWRKNKYGIDPDYPNAEFPAPKTIAFGIQVGL